MWWSHGGSLAFTPGLKPGALPLDYVELRNDFGQTLYDKVRKQIYGPLWAKNDADRKAIVEELQNL